MPLEVNLDNLMQVLKKVTEVDDLGLHLGVPEHELAQISREFRETDEQKREILKWWLKNDLVEWERVTTALRAMNKPVLADAVTVVSKCESLHDQPKEKSQRWEENLNSLNGRVQDFYLEQEWKKGEEKWLKFLKKSKHFVEVWEELINSQQTERAFLTLGITTFNFDFKLLHQTNMLEHKAQQHKARSMELSKFFRRAKEHRHELQNTEIKLEAREKKLCEHVSKLEKHIDEMQALRVEFLGEAQDCIVQLEQVEIRLQTCRKKMHECRNELTKPKRQLQKCQDKLTECEANLKRCRDELDNSHSQIKQVIQGLRKKSNDLSGEITKYTAAGGGTGAGTGVVIGLPLGAVIGLPFAPIAAVIGTGLGMVGGYLYACKREKKLEETREKMQSCADELNNCSKVIEECENLLKNSEETLKELQRSMSGLEQTFYRLELEDKLSDLKQLPILYYH